MTLELPAQRIREALQLAGIRDESIFLADEFYTLPTRGDVMNKLAREFTSILRQTNFTWAEDRRDCDDFARWAAGWAGLFHAERGIASGLAFGEVWCSKLQHAFNFAVHLDFAASRDGTASTISASSLRIVFYEPQITAGNISMSELALTREEVNSIYLAKA
jgi:hypothetical protein